MKGHWYAVTAVKSVPVASSSVSFSSMLWPEKLDMVRLRNPVGHGEWRGRFSDGCVLHCSWSVMLIDIVIVIPVSFPGNWDTL